MEVILEMFFLALTNGNFQFGAKKLTWRFYTIAKALFTTSWVKLIDNREFAKVVLDKNFKTFVVYVAAPEAEISIYLLQAPQIVALH